MYESGPCVLFPFQYILEYFLLWMSTIREIELLKKCFLEVILGLAARIMILVPEGDGLLSMIWMHAESFYVFLQIWLKESVVLYKSC